MFVISVSLNERGKELLGRFQHVVPKDWFSLSSFERKELVIEMRMAKFQDNGNLAMKQSNDNTSDVFDSAGLALKMFQGRPN